MSRVKHEVVRRRPIHCSHDHIREQSYSFTRSTFDTTGFASVINYLSIVTHFENFSKGVLELKDIVFYISMIFFSLFLTSRAMESLRWRA